MFTDPLNPYARSFLGPGVAHSVFDSVSAEMRRRQKEEDAKTIREFVQNLGSIRVALKDEGFSDEGAEQIVIHVLHQASDEVQ